MVSKTQAEKDKEAMDKLQDRLDQFNQWHAEYKASQKKLDSFKIRLLQARIGNEKLRTPLLKQKVQTEKIRQFVMLVQAYYGLKKSHLSLEQVAHGIDNINKYLEKR